MMNKFLVPGLLLLFSLTACKQDEKGGSTASSGSESTSASTLSGFWVPIDFCSRAGKQGSFIKAVNSGSKPYAYAMAFDSNNPDSVTLYNGFETWKMNVTYRKDTLEIKKAHGDLSIYLVYDPTDNKDLTMFDGTNGSTELNRFTLSKAQSNNAYAAFLTALNNSMMSGAFQLSGQGEVVRFTPSGTIMGFPAYDQYELCTGGDCAVMKDMDVVTMRSSKKAGSEKMFGYRFSEKKDTLLVYNLINQNPAEKGAYTAGAVAQTFLRKTGK